MNALISRSLQLGRILCEQICCGSATSRASSPQHRGGFPTPSLLPSQCTRWNLSRRFRVQPPSQPPFSTSGTRGQQRCDCVVFNPSAVWETKVVGCCSGERAGWLAARFHRTYEGGGDKERERAAVKRKKKGSVPSLLFPAFVMTRRC